MVHFFRQCLNWKPLFWLLLPTSSYDEEEDGICCCGTLSIIATSTKVGFWSLICDSASSLTSYKLIIFFALDFKDKQAILLKIGTEFFGMDDFVPVLFSKFCACVVLLARDEFSIQFPGVAFAGTLWKVMLKSRKEKNMYLLSFFWVYTLGDFSRDEHVWLLSQLKSRQMTAKKEWLCWLWWLKTSALYIFEY